MQKNVVFIYSSAHGHLAKSLMISRFYQSKGYAVHYYIFGKNNLFETQTTVPITRMYARPFGINNETFSDASPPIQLSWWRELLTRHSGKHYRKRKAEIEQLIAETDPTLIFLDEFCATDFIILYSHLTNRRCIVLAHCLPFVPGEYIPPFHLFEGPGEQAKALWHTYLRRKFRKQRTNTLKFLGRDHTGIVNSRFREQQIPAKHRPTFILERVPFFGALEKWYLVPYEIDFEQQALPAGHRYMGSMLAVDRLETFSQHYQLFLKFIANKPDSKLIFCALGTVISSTVNDPAVLVNFYTNLLQIAQANPHLFLLVQTDSRVSSMMKTKTLNCMFIQFAPQLDVLKRADVFINHGGGNSTVEAIWTATPMLIVPPVNRWDYNGYAARVVHHQLGLKANLTDSAAQLKLAIDELLQNDLYKTKIEQMSQVFQTKYHPNYLHELPMPLP